MHYLNVKDMVLRYFQGATPSDPHSSMIPLPNSWYCQLGILPPSTLFGSSGSSISYGENEVLIYSTPSSHDLLQEVIDF